MKNTQNQNKTQGKEIMQKEKEERIMREILEDFWKDFHERDIQYLSNYLAHETGTYKLNIEKGIKKIHKLYLGNPTTIKRLRRDKELLRLSLNQIKEENLKLKKEGRCENCRKEISYEAGGTKKRNFGWCSEKCEQEYYSFINRKNEKHTKSE